MSDRPIVLMVSMEARAEYEDQMREILRKVASQSLEEEGCLIYQLLEDRKTPGHFLLIEKWRDSSAFKAHQDSVHLATAFAEMDSVQARAPAFVPWRAID